MRIDGIDTAHTARTKDLFAHSSESAADSATSGGCDSCEAESRLDWMRQTAERANAALRFRPLFPRESGGIRRSQVRRLVHIGNRSGRSPRGMCLAIYDMLLKHASRRLASRMLDEMAHDHRAMERSQARQALLRERSGFDG